MWCFQVLTLLAKNASQATEEHGPLGMTQFPILKFNSNMGLKLLALNLSYEGALASLEHQVSLLF